MKKKLIWMLIALLIVPVVFVFGTIAAARIKMSGTVTLPKETVAVPTSAEAIGEGRRLFVSRSCVDCHGDDLAGQVVIDDLIAGTMAGTNLTSGQGGIAGKYKEDSDWVMAIRHGVDPAGHKLIFMPAYEYHHLSDSEVGALIAYIKNAPPVDKTPPKHFVGFMASLLYLIGDMPLVSTDLIPQEAPHTTAGTPEKGLPLGRHLAQGCIGCHGPGFSGGGIPGVPPSFPKAANITPHRETGIGDWKEADFIGVMKTGKRPDGSDVNPFMPWKNFREMTGEELSSLWEFLRTVPEKPFGGR